MASGMSHCDLCIFSGDMVGHELSGRNPSTVEISAGLLHLPLALSSATIFGKCRVHRRGTEIFLPLCHTRAALAVSQGKGP